MKNDENIEDGPLRVLGNKNKKFGLSITRSIGDFECEDLGIINDVEHFEFELCGYDKYVIVVSDGVWNVMNSDEICGFINEYRDKYELCELLLNECRERVYDRNDKNF